MSAGASADPLDPAGPGTAAGVQLSLAVEVAASVARDGPGRRRLTEEQEEAVRRREGSLLLAAGAGSGKTSVLVERFVRAVREDGVAPGRILAITFTERAAGELRERVRARFVELGEREAARETEAAFVSTFHGFCARLLRIHPLLAGLDPEFAILDEPQAARLRMLAFRGALGDFQAQEGALAVDLLAAYRIERVRAMVLGVYGQLRSEGRRDPVLPVPPTTPDSADAVSACSLLDVLLRRFGERYGELKDERGALDFDDLELRAGALLAQREDVRGSWSERLELLMVDEFQDTNPRQLAILEALARENLFTVGDELQSIYGFRHADLSLFRARRERLAACGASLALRTNFRSRPSLLAAINAVFAGRFGDGYTPLLAGREGSEGTPIELLLTDQRGWGEHRAAEGVASGLPEAPRWRQAEARLLAQRVAELIAGGEARAGGVAVLLRAAGDLPVYQRALEERGLRTLAPVGSFWGHQQVGDLLAYLRALANPLDELALYSTLASPLVGISSDGLALIARWARGVGGGRGGGEDGPARAESEGVSAIGGDRAGRAGGSVWATLIGAEGLRERLSVLDRGRLERFVPFFVAERAGVPRRGLGELLLRVIAASGYERQVLALQWGERRLANVQKLVALARRFEAQEGRDLRGFLDHVAHQREVLERAEPEAPVGEIEPEAVRLMTIHAAKGLEFDVVCLADLGRALNGGSPDLIVEGGRIGLRLAGLDGGEARPSPDYEELAQERRLAGAREEERIFYVALTRARERLLVSGAVDFGRWPAERPGGPPIAWLGPALVPELALRAAELRAPAGEEADGAGGVPVRCWLNAPATFGAVLREESLGGCGPPAPDLAGEGGAEVAGTGGAGVVGSSGAGVVEEGGAGVVGASGAPAALEPATRAGAGPVAPEIPLSYTALSELERCGYRYYLERVLGLPEDRVAAAREAGGGLEGRLRGTIVHRLLESLDFARPAPPTPQEVGRVGRGLGVRLSSEERAEIARLVAAACAGRLARRLASARAVHREHPFAFSLGPGEPLVTGVLDLLVREPDGSCLIVDYKSDRVAEGADLPALAVETYGAQRLLYALAALHDGAREVEVVHWFLARPEDPVSVRYGGGERESLERELMARVGEARRRGFAVSETPHRALCLSCPGRATLCSWGEEETLREDRPPSFT